MVARTHEGLQNAQHFPEKWCKEVEAIFNQTYSAQCQKEKKTFEAFAFTYPDELLLCVSLVDPSQHAIAPITYKASIELSEDQKKANDDEPQAIVHKLVDSASIFFDSYFAGAINEETYSPVWTETKLLKLTFHYQVSRENIKLTLEADKLLKE